MSTRSTGRRRAPGRPTSPLTQLHTAVSASAQTLGRGSAVVVASGGLVATMGLPAGATQGAPEAAPVTGAVAASEVASAVAAAQSAVAAAPVAAAPDAQVAFERTAFTAVPAPPPPPPPPPAPEPERERSSERSGDREERASRSGGERVASGGVLAVAARYVGVPYRYGGTTPSGFDCSGFTQYVFAQVGVSLPRTSSAQASAGYRVSASEARPGDLVYQPGHIGIYAGDGMMYDAPRTGKSVSLRKIWMSSPQYIRVLG